MTITPWRAGVLVAWLVSLLAWPAGSVQAQSQTQSPPVSLALEDALARAMGASQRLAEARAREAAAEAGVAIRHAADLPQAVATAGFTRTNHIPEFVVPAPGGGSRVLYPDVPNNYRARIDLQWPIYNGGRTDALERAARAEATAAGAEVGVARADLRFEVSRLYWALVTARASRDVLERALTRADTHVRAARARLDAGLVPPNDVSSAEAQASRARMLLIEARNQVTSVASELARLTDIEAGTDIEPSEPLEAAPLAPAPLGTLVEGALRARDERRILTARADAADEQQTAALAGRRPVVSIAGGADIARPNPRIFPRVDAWNDSWEAGVNVSWALWDGGRARAEAAQAGNLALAARARLAEFDSQLGVQVRQRRLEIESGRAAVQAAGDGVRAATDARRVLVERYAAGVVDSTDVLDAEFALLQAELDLTRAQAGVRLSEAGLARVLGR
ncbi:MAG: TolC family protein [Vicinamibacterales bacterium]